MAESGEDLQVQQQHQLSKNQPDIQIYSMHDDEAGNRDATVQKQTRPSSANKAATRPHSVAHTLHWFACVGEDLDDSSATNGCGNEDDLQREREERIKQTKERQNEERQRKLEELKAQALAAQKFREQKEEERRRRMEDLRRRENDRRSQVEERRRAIQEAENERRQYILQKNQERDQRMDAKRRNERSSIQFAFGSSTPRMIESSDSGMCSSFWAHRRATSITNVAYTGAPLTRRSSERELTDGGSKKRATSASGLDRSTDDDSADMSYQRTVNRRKTDLMPTIPSPRDSSRSSFGTHTPRTPGRAFSMTRLDQLAQPRRRNGEHISAILERERKQALELEHLTRLSLSSSRSSPTADSGKRMSRSMSQLATVAGGSHSKFRSSHDGGRGVRKSSFNASSTSSSAAAVDSPMGLRSDTSKSMSQLNTAGRHHVSRLTKTERLRQQVREQLNGQSATTTTLVSTIATGLRSGEITPNSLNTSRPGSAMSSSTTASGVVYRRSLPASAGSQRKPRPISIAVTGVSGLAKEEKPPLPKASGASNTSSTSLERKRSQSGTSTPAKPASADTPVRKHSSAERPQRVSSNSSARGTPKASSTPLQSPGPEKANRTMHDTLQKTAKKQASQEQLHAGLAKEGSSVSAKNTEEKVEAVVVEQKQLQQEEQLTVTVPESVATTENVVVVQEQEQKQQIIVTESKTEVVAEPEPVKEQEPEPIANSHEEKKDDMKDSVVVVAPPPPAAVSNLLDAVVQDGSNGDLMTASMIAKRITTEEEAKAALAERRRLAREEAERQAELERQRIAAEEEAELQRQYEEEERLRKLEEESIRLAEEARRLEEERLEQAIQETAKREEEERQRREEEARQKVEREESERKAREEAERQRIEMAERLKKEEKEREERRKRVEAIMLRTRAKGSANNTPTKQSDEKDNAMSKSHIVTSSTPAVMAESTMSMTDSMLGSVDQPQELLEQAPSSGAESLEQAVQSLSLDNGLNNNNNNNNNGNHNNNFDGAADYERSVTEKENLLLGSAFTNNNSNTSNSTPTSLQPSSLESASTTPTPATTNGKSTPGVTPTIDAETTELIIEDAIAMSGQTNGHKNGSIDNVLLVALVNE